MKNTNLKKFNHQFLAITFITLFVVLLGLYATYLNHVYYANYGPFYDSMSYMNQLAMIMSVSSRDGLLDAIGSAAAGSTVFFPWLEGVILGFFLAPEREYAVLIQLPLVLTQAISAYIYFKTVSKYSTVLSVVFSLTLITYSAIFFYNGGLSDLRMDLSQTLALGSALAFFAVGHHTKQLRYWVMFGGMLGISFLVRATTPVYAALIFGTCFLVDVIVNRADLKNILKLYTLAIFVALSLSVWFFIINFNELYYYYFVWNYDANAALPVSQSKQHLIFLFVNHIGLPFCALISSVFLIVLYSSFTTIKSLANTLNWPMFLGGVMPVGFLVLFGAAPNPFVSMASVPGVLMFLLAPVVSNKPLPAFKIKEFLFITFAIISVGLNGFGGLQSHKEIASPWVSDIAGLKEIAHEIVVDIQKNGKKDSSFEFSFVGSVDSNAILNVFVFNEGFILSKKEAGNVFATKSNITVSGLQPGLANPVEWRQISGAEPQDKLKFLVSEAVKSVDYLILPENGTIFVPHHPISPYAFEFRDLLISTNAFMKISEPIKISKLESVTIYKNVKR